MVSDTDWLLPMKLRHSLRFRIIFAFCLFGGLLGSFYALIVYVSLDRIDDHLIDNRLSQVVEQVMVHFQETPDRPLPDIQHIRAFTGTDTMPGVLREALQGLPEGYYERYINNEEYHVVVQVVPELVEPVYLLYAVGTLEFTEKRKGGIALVLLVGVLLVVVLGLWIGIWMSRRVIAPITHLASSVKGLNPEDFPKDLSEKFYDDELGVLAVALSDSMRRVNTFVTREKQFSSDASHELRSPVTVIRGAVEIMESLQTTRDPIYQRPLARIRRAVSDMENILESLLWLARQEAVSENRETCHPAVVIKEAIEQQRHLFREKPVVVEYVAEADPELEVPPTIFKIIIVNLIQNAFSYTVEGNIMIRTCDDGVVISDTGVGIDGCDLPSITEPHQRGCKSCGFGLGLAIVKRLCDRFGWQFTIDSEPGQGTTVKLVFSSS
jgi:signal transduction histidine kinase